MAGVQCGPDGLGPVTLADFGRLARERLDRRVWDQIEGGADEERTVRANRKAFDRVEWCPRVLRGAGLPTTATRILGRDWAAPIGIAPMGFHTAVHPEGEVATARAAGSTGLPFVVGMFAGRLLETIAEAATAPLWLQIHCLRDRSATRRLIDRAAAAGFEALVVSVDAPRPGRRLRELRNGSRLPPGCAAVNLDASGSGSPLDLELVAFDPSPGWPVIEWLRKVSPLPILLKGLMSVPDPRQAVLRGVDGIIVSNQGGRGLDGTVATLVALPAIAEAVGGAVPVLIDGGIRRGSDVLAAIALGADAVLLGRPVLHGLAVGGQEGVENVMDILIGELTTTMALAGASDLSEAGPELIATRFRGGRAEPAPDRAAHDAAIDGGVNDTSRVAHRLSRPSEPLRRLPPATADLFRHDLHASVSDPVLDTMNFLNEVTRRHPDAISFAAGRPYDGFFDVEQIFTYLREYLKHLHEQGRSPSEIRDTLFQYGPTGGRIRDVIAGALHADEGIDIAPEAVVVTVGCQEAMFLVLRALIAEPYDVLLVSSPCYVGITGAARLLDVDTVPVEEHPDGFRCADLEAAVLAELARGRRPRAFYLVPDHSNPRGTTMPLAERRELLALAERFDLLIIEDSPYRLVSPGERIPTLKSLDNGCRVVLLGSFAKTLFPGARVGFAVADQTVVDAAGRVGLLADELVKIKSMVTVNTSPLSQAVVAGMLLAGTGGVAEFAQRPTAHYADAMRSTLRELETRFPADRRAELGVAWNEPTGGFFLSMTVPFRADDAALARSAEEFGVLWTPMAYFHPTGGGTHELRLSVSYLSPDDITEGISRLAHFVEAEARAVADGT